MNVLFFIRIMFKTILLIRVDSCTLHPRRAKVQRRFGVEYINVKLVKSAKPGMNLNERKRCMA